MPTVQMREITAAKRLDNVRYAIRDLAGLADEVTKQGHKILPLTVGDPNIFDFETPAHVVDAVVKAMRDNKNGYAPSPGIPEALQAVSSRLDALDAARAEIARLEDHTTVAPALSTARTFTDAPSG